MPENGSSVKRWVADLVMPWAARHATVWPSTHAQLGVHLGEKKELFAEVERLRGENRVLRQWARRAGWTPPR